MYTHPACRPYWTWRTWIPCRPCTSLSGTWTGSPSPTWGPSGGSSRTLGTRSSPCPCPCPCPIVRPALKREDNILKNSSIYSTYCTYMYFKAFAQRAPFVSKHRQYATCLSLLLVCLLFSEAGSILPVSWQVEQNFRRWHQCVGFFPAFILWWLALTG